MSKPRKNTVKLESVKQTEKRIAQVAKDIARVGRLRDKKGRFVKASKQQINRVIKSVSKDAKQTAKTGKAVRNLASELAKLFTPAKKQPAKSTPAKKQPAKKQPAKSTPAKKQPAKKQPAKRVESPRKRETIYELVDLPEAFNNETLKGTLEELEENADNYDTLLRDGEGWGFKFGSPGRQGYSYKFYSNFSLLLADFAKYNTVEQFGDDPIASEDLKEWLKIIRFRAPGKNPSFLDSDNAWLERRNAQTEKQKDKVQQRRVKAENKRKQLRAAESVVKKTRKELRKKQEEITEKEFERRRFAALLRDEKAAREAAEKRVAELEGQLKKKSMPRKGRNKK